MASKSPYSVGRTLLGAAVLFGLGAGAFGLAYSEARTVMREVGAGDAVVALWSSVLGGFPLAAMFLAATILLLLSLRADRARQSAKPLMVFVFASFLLTFIVPWLGETMVGDRLGRSGYVRCPTIYERPIARVRWSRSLADCPITGRRGSIAPRPGA